MVYQAQRHPLPAAGGFFVGFACVGSGGKRFRLKQFQEGEEKGVILQPSSGHLPSEYVLLLA